MLVFVCADGLAVRRLNGAFEAVLNVISVRVSCLLSVVYEKLGQRCSIPRRLEVLEKKEAITA